MSAPAGFRPRLKETIELIGGGDGRLYLFRGGDNDFAVNDTPAVRRLLALLDGTRTEGEVVTALAREFPDADEIDGAITALHELGLVEDASADRLLGPRDLVRYDRQLRYFGDLAPPRAARASYQEALGRARVVVLGAGGLGGWAAYALASAGIGRIEIVDGDFVELSNLNRQILFRERDIGEPKAEAAARALAELNSDIKVSAHQAFVSSESDVVALTAGADFVIDAADFPPHEIEHWVNAACMTSRIPFAMMSQFPPLVRLGPTYLPGTTGCYRCQERGWERDHARYGDVVRARKGIPCPASALGPACGFIGAQIAVDVVHLLSGIARPATAGRSITIDLRTFEMSADVLIRDPECEVCGRGRPQ